MVCNVAGRCRMHCKTINIVNFGVYKRAACEVENNLPGTGDTVIKKAVPSGGDLCIALSQVEACDFPKRGKLGCAIFGSGGLRSRIPLPHHKQTKQFFFLIHRFYRLCRISCKQLRMRIVLKNGCIESWRQVAENLVIMTSIYWVWNKMNGTTHLTIFSSRDL